MSNNVTIRKKKILIVLKRVFSLLMFSMKAPSLRNGTERPFFLVEYTGEGYASEDPSCPKLGPGLAVSILPIIYYEEFSHQPLLISYNTKQGVPLASSIVSQTVYVKTPSTTHTPASGL